MGVPPSEPKAVLDQRGGNLALDLFVLSQHVGRLLDTALAGTGVTASTYAVYSQLARGPRTPRELSETLGLRPTTLSGYVNALQHAGHITKTRHAQDGRSKVLELTESGHAKVVECRPLVRKAVRALNDRVGSSENVAQTRALLARVDAAIDGVLGELSPPG